MSAPTGRLAWRITGWRQRRAAWRQARRAIERLHDELCRPPHPCPHHAPRGGTR